MELIRKCSDGPAVNYEEYQGVSERENNERNVTHVGGCVQ